ncbi:host attachment protein [Halobacteriovorax sp.]|uniref:host attachment protein n=1 Tax=Halobacteriovorax sp. TaxID=2020862 RepID=UPI003AF1E500
MNRSWVIVANKSSARVYERIKRKDLKLIESLENPTAKTSESEQVSDRRGSMSQSHSHGQQSFSPKTTAKEHNEISFAKEINDFLEKNRTRNKFDELEIVAAPSFLGILKKNLDKELGKQVTQYTNKDFGERSDREIKKLIAS